MPITVEFMRAYDKPTPAIARSSAYWRSRMMHDPDFRVEKQRTNQVGIKGGHG